SLSHKEFILRWLCFAFNGQGRDGIVRRFLRQAGEADAVAILLELDLLASGQQASRFDLRHQAGNGHRRAWPEMDMQIKCVRAAREAAKSTAARLAPVSPVN